MLNQMGFIVGSICILIILSSFMGILNWKIMMYNTSLLTKTWDFLAYKYFTSYPNVLPLDTKGDLMETHP